MKYRKRFRIDRPIVYMKSNLIRFNKFAQILYGIEAPKKVRFFINEIDDTLLFYFTNNGGAKCSVTRSNGITISRAKFLLYRCLECKGYDIEKILTKRMFDVHRKGYMQFIDIKDCRRTKMNKVEL